MPFTGIWRAAATKARSASAIYYYDAAENKIEEKAFITSTKSFAIAEDELGKMVYYNQSTSLLHVLADGTLYRIDLKKDEKKVLAENLTDERYAVSDDGHHYGCIRPEGKQISPRRFI